MVDNFYSSDYIYVEKRMLGNFRFYRSASVFLHDMGQFPFGFYLSISKPASLL